MKIIPTKCWLDDVAKRTMFVFKDAIYFSNYFSLFDIDSSECSLHINLKKQLIFQSISIKKMDRTNSVIRLIYQGLSTENSICESTVGHSQS